MRHLNLIKQDHILKLRRIPDYRSFTDDGISADKRTLSYLRVLPDDRRPMNVRGFEYLRGPGDPHILSDFIIFIFRKRRAETQNEFADLRKHLPRIGDSLEDIFRNRLLQCVQFLYCQSVHTVCSSLSVLFFSLFIGCRRFIVTSLKLTLIT